MSWVEEQWWFGLEDLALAAEEQYYQTKHLIYNGIWTTKDGAKIPIDRMDDNHLKNSIRMIEEGRLDRKYALPILLSEKKRRGL